MPEECRKRISESNKIILIEKSEEEKEEIKENNNNDYWNDLINERNVTLKNNGNCDYLRIYNILIIFFICLKFLI